MVNGAQHFFFIAGISNKSVTLNRDGAECPQCGSSNISLKREDMWFSFFFIPLFPIKRGKPYIVCHQCSDAISAEELATCTHCNRSFSRHYSYCPHCGDKNER